MAGFPPFPFDPLIPGATSIKGNLFTKVNSAGGLGACAVKMAGAEHGKADVGEGRMAASEGANGGEYADEGQDRRGGKKKFSQAVSISYTIL